VGTLSAAVIHGQAHCTDLANHLARLWKRRHLKLSAVVRRRRPAELAARVDNLGCCAPESPRFSDAILFVLYWRIKHVRKFLRRSNGSVDVRGCEPGEWIGFLSVFLDHSQLGIG
jgi:hypothetical protein